MEFFVGFVTILALLWMASKGIPIADFIFGLVFVVGLIGLFGALCGAVGRLILRGL